MKCGQHFLAIMSFIIDDLYSLCPGNTSIKAVNVTISTFINLGFIKFQKSTMNRAKNNKVIYLSITPVIYIDHEEICLVCINSSNSNVHNLNFFLFK